MCGELYYRVSLGTIWVESFLWGAYVLLFASYLYIHIAIRPNKFFFVAAVLMFTLSTLLMVNDVGEYFLTPKITCGYQCSLVICTPCPGIPDDLYEDNVTNLSTIIRDLALMINQAVADSLLLYRLHAMWRNTSRMSVLPTVLVVATAAFGFCRVYYDTQIYLIRLRDTIDAPPETTEWDTSIMLTDNMAITNYSLSIASNILLTGMIVLRVGNMLRELRHHPAKSLRSKVKSIMAMLIESGAIYTGSVMIDLVVSFTPSATYESVTNAALNQIVGIMPTLIMVRVGLGHGAEQTVIHVQSDSNKPAAPLPTSTLSRPMEFALPENHSAASVPEIEEVPAGSNIGPL